jgi:NADH-quinone oxidoreductase subunit C
MTASEIIAHLQSALPGASFAEVAAADADQTPTIQVPIAQLLDTCRALRDLTGLEFVGFSDVTAADFFPRRDPRFDLVYHLISPHRRARMRVKVVVGGGEAVPSVTSVWPGAGWPEREVFDLFGIVFEGHGDLRRLLMPEDWEGYPLRKDYPVQVRKDTETYMPLQITEEEFKASFERDRMVRPVTRT